MEEMPLSVALHCDEHTRVVLVRQPRSTYLPPYSSLEFHHRKNANQRVVVFLTPAVERALRAELVRTADGCEPAPETMVAVGFADVEPRRHTTPECSCGEPTCLGAYGEPALPEAVEPDPDEKCDAARNGDHEDVVF